MVLLPTAPAASPNTPPAASAFDNVFAEFQFMSD
jgi:hypothetical protein